MNPSANARSIMTATDINPMTDLRIAFTTTIDHCKSPNSFDVRLSP